MHFQVRIIYRNCDFGAFSHHWIEHCLFCLTGHLALTDLELHNRINVSQVDSGSVVCSSFNNGMLQ